MEWFGSFLTLFTILGQTSIQKAIEKFEESTGDDVGTAEKVMLCGQMPPILKMDMSLNRVLDSVLVIVIFRIKKHHSIEFESFFCFLRVDLSAALDSWLLASILLFPATISSEYAVLEN